MLMFSKTSIPSFVYDPIDVSIFPDEDVKEIYENIWNWKMLLVSEFNRHKQYFSIFFFVCKLSCSIDEEKQEIKSKILDRLDL